MLSPLLLVSIVLSAPLYSETEGAIDTYLEKQSSQALSFKDRLRLVIYGTLGTPYQDGPLGEGSTGKYDKDPLIDLGKVDCVTYVEQSVAMATAHSYPALVQNLQKIRYKDGVVDFETRNHFMITDWIWNNEWCDDVTPTLGMPIKTVTRRISKKEFFEKVKAPGLGADVDNANVTINVISPELTGAAEQKIPDGSLIVFVGKVDWLFSLHCGVYLKDETGEGRLIHASSKAGKVVSMSLAQYMNEQSSRYIGFSVYDMKKPGFDNE
jgi:D-alanyl-D-alanine carboxypeptidase/D-alanyl-D-alanine-endopeptidase (penicillin-binding protein 4)